MAIKTFFPNYMRRYKEIRKGKSINELNFCLVILLQRKSTLCARQYLLIAMGHTLLSSCFSAGEIGLVA